MKSKKTLSLYLGLLALVLLLMATLRILNRREPMETGPRDYPEIKEEHVLRIAIEYNSNSYHVSGDTLAGEDYDLCKLIEKKSGLKVEIYPEMNLNNSLDGLKERRIDVVARNIPITSVGKEEFRFTNPINRSRLVLVQRTMEANGGKEPIRNQLDLGGKNIYIQQGSAARLRIENLSVEMADSIFIKEEPLYGEEQLIIKVAKGEIDYAICEEKIAQKLVKLYPEIDILTAVGFTQLRGWAVRPESTILLDSLNAWLETGTDE